MIYELAKQLKDAGWKQPDDMKDSFEGGWKCDDDNGDRGSWGRSTMCKGETAYAPTLSELINACGDRFLRLTKHLDLREPYWRASDYNNDFLGSTPEEAVAKLWLVLKNANNQIKKV